MIRPRAEMQSRQPPDAKSGDVIDVTLAQGPENELRAQVRGQRRSGVTV